MIFHESFLKSGLYVYMKADQAFPRSSGAYSFPYVGNRALYASNVRFPALCIGCVAPTHSFTSKEFVCLLKYISGTSITSVTLKPVFQIPVCSPCAGYGLLDHAGVYTNVAGNIPRTLLVSFKFPNIGFYKHFAEANRLDPSGWLAGNTIIPKQTPKYVALLDKLLEEWQDVEAFGFHRCLAVKAKLIVLHEKYSWFNRRKHRAEIEAELRVIMANHGLAAPDLRLVRKFMNQKLHIPEI